MNRQLQTVLDSITDFIEVLRAARDERALQAIPLTVQRQRDPRNVRRQ